MYVRRNIFVRSHDICTSSAILTAWHHFTRRDRVFGAILCFHNKQQFGFHLQRPTLFFHCNQIWGLSTQFNRPNRQPYYALILWELWEWEVRWYCSERARLCEICGVHTDILFWAGQIMWDLWCTHWHWNRFSSEYFSCLLSVSYLTVCYIMMLQLLRLYSVGVSAGLDMGHLWKDPDRDNRGKSSP